MKVLAIEKNISLIFTALDAQKKELQEVTLNLKTGDILQIKEGSTAEKFVKESIKDDDQVTIVYDKGNV